ncbi:CocE/NonD family hydrolase [Actinomadura chibensis]|uniref:CocE/NonD family hydrolase n=1 Tax=Actinomadura chibensis TaxID=392828 RepID=A0A5D0NN39_9ACTN|nr:CocE/NonD family hydrolase [Actinomadura chibensis]TYB45688.1 CocE/NonD family hydrolase [Actinomadura chibensis]
MRAKRRMTWAGGRRRSWRLSLGAAVFVLGGMAVAPGASAAGKGAAAPDQCEYTVQKDVPATMRDGTVLRSNVFTPKGDGDFPVILMRLPYNKEGAENIFYANPDRYASACYLVVVQDVRGQYKSDGEFYAYKYEAEDGYDTIEWSAKLPHSNGKVGMYGFSYPGLTQWLPATLTPPHLVTIVPAFTSSDIYDGWTYEGGALYQSFTEDWPLSFLARGAIQRLPDYPKLSAEMSQASRALFAKWYWHMPLNEFPPLYPKDKRVARYFYDWVDHPSFDSYWKRWSIREKYPKVTVPALNYGGWSDIFLNGTVENFAGMRARGGSATARNGTKLLVGPWTHGSSGSRVGALDYGPEAVVSIDEVQFRWFDHWLKGVDNGVDKDPAVKIFVMGANKWRTADSWPIPGTAFTEYYLHSNGDANTVTGGGTLSTTAPAAETPDRYRYDPENPVPSFGGRFQSSVPGGPQDQRLIEQRPDVLVYTTPRLATDTEVTGPISVTLYASSSARDTDWTAKITDVGPDGTSMLVRDGIQRARYRVSLERPSLIRPGKVYKYTIKLWPTSNVFKAGHRLRLEISSSNFPMYDRNPNTGAEFGTGDRTKPAAQTIYHDAEHPSSVTLPIIPTPID